MRVLIVDIEWYNKVSFTPNVTCMKLSSYHLQLGDSVFLAEDKYSFSLDYDIMYVVRESLQGKLPTECNVRSPKAKLIGPGFKFFSRYMKGIPSEVAACRPDYLLYPIKEETKYNKADMVQFYNDGQRLNLIQDYRNSYKKSHLTVIVDKGFWSKTEEDIKFCLDILEQKGAKNIVFSQPISLKDIVLRPNIQKLFLSVKHEGSTYIKFINDCGFRHNREIFDFLKEYKTLHPLDKFPPVYFDGVTTDHINDPESAIEDVKRCIQLIAEAKQAEVMIYISSPNRIRTPFWFYFDTLQYWCKYGAKMSLIECWLHSACSMNKSNIEFIIAHPLKWNTVTSEMLRDLTRRCPETISKYGFIRWGQERYENLEFRKLYLGE